MMKENLEKLIRELPDDLQKEVIDFVKSLLEKRQKKAEKKGRLKMDWAGALADYKHNFTSVELQHLTVKWWLENIKGEISC